MPDASVSAGSDSPPPEAARFGARMVLAGVALALIAVPFALLLLLVQDKWRPLLRVDEGARDHLHRYALHHSGFVTGLKLVSFAGSTPVYVLVFSVVSGWLVHRGLRRLAVFVIVTVLGSSISNNLVKHAVHRARPVLPDPLVHLNSKSFPSGHAQAAVVAYAVLLLVFLPALRGAWRRIAPAAAAVMVVLIGFSRVALGVHYVSDVLAGYLLGGAWVAASTAAFSAWRHERGRPRVDPAQGLEPEHAVQLDPLSSERPHSSGRS